MSVGGVCECYQPPTRPPLVDGLYIRTACAKLQSGCHGGVGGWGPGCRQGQVQAGTAEKVSGVT